MIGFLEKKFGRFGINDLMKYILGINIIGNIINVIFPGIYYEFLSLDINAICHGQVYRLVTFLMFPTVGRSQSFFIDLIWYVIWVFMYYFVGKNLEKMWGKFRFTLFYLFGMIFTILVTVGFYLYYKLTGGMIVLGTAKLVDPGSYLGLLASPEHINTSLFLAFASMFPNAQFLIYFIIPIKAKWLSIAYLVLCGFNVVQSIMHGDFFTAALIVVSVLNFVIFFLASRKPSMYNPNEVFVKQKKRKKKKKQGASAKDIKLTRHRCAICGRTEKDSPMLEFRYCSKCEGNYEYCNDHIFTHEHVHKL